MKNKAEHIFECKKENEAHLQAVYTELFITEGDMKDINQEHEILKIDDAFNKNKQTQDKPIKCNDIFILLRETKSRGKDCADQGHRWYWKNCLCAQIHPGLGRRKSQSGHRLCVPASIPRD